MLRDLLHQVGDGLVNLAALIVEQFQLGQETAHFEVDRIRQETDPHRLASLSLKLFSLFQSEAAVAGFVQDLSQLLEVKIGEFLGRNGFLQYGPGRLAGKRWRTGARILGRPHRGWSRACV